MRSLRVWVLAVGLFPSGTVPFLAAAAPCLLLPAPPASAGDQDDKPQVDETQVYYGNATAFRAPAEVDVDRVYRAIPEYRTILDEKLTEKHARYTVLLLKATRKFRSAIKSAAKDGSYDLVGNTGAIVLKGKTVPDITEAVLKKVQEPAR